MDMELMADFLASMAMSGVNVVIVDEDGIQPIYGGDTDGNKDTEHQELCR